MGRVGVLALQGDFAAHGRMLERLEVDWQEVRTPRQLAQVEGLIIPGGESTTLLKLLVTSGLWEALGPFHAAGHPLMGTCAGLIVLARETRQPAQASLGYIDVVAVRNAYGRQVDSFIDKGTPLDPALDLTPLEMVFIRAPKMMELGPQVVPLAMCRGDVVLARQRTVLVATFHPEMTTDPRVHQYFLDMIAAT
jgi:pyridoxal 5'-phosphate synthase pdxT subunit